jgi:hypothetical protein
VPTAVFTPQGPVFGPAPVFLLATQRTIPTRLAVRRFFDASERAGHRPSLKQKDGFLGGLGSRNAASPTAGC